jgi:hypothetical protein
LIVFAALGASGFIGMKSGERERKNKDIASQLTYNVAGDDRVINLDEKREFLDSIGYDRVIDVGDGLSFVGSSDGVTAYLNYSRSRRSGLFNNSVESCSYSRRLSDGDIARTLGD